MRCLFSQAFQENTIRSDGCPFLNKCLDGSQIGSGQNLSIDRNASCFHQWDGFRYRGRLFIQDNQCVRGKNGGQMTGIRTEFACEITNCRHAQRLQFLQSLQALRQGIFLVRHKPDGGFDAVDRILQFIDVFS